MSEKPYLHGYNETEQQRLVSQAKFLEPKVFEKIDFSAARHILEIGCGVGAQTEILLRKYPQAHITGIELSDAQLETAKKYLQSLKIYEGRYTLLKMNAEAMNFDGKLFDAAYICWVLEHLSEPVKVLKEAKKVLKKGGILSVTEVFNHSLHLEPRSTFLQNYWEIYNNFQISIGGDPHVGVKLGKYLSDAGFTDMKVYPQTMFHDKRNPAAREAMINYWTELMLSGFDNLLNANLVKPSDRALLKAEMDKVKQSDKGIYYYSFIQAEVVKVI